MEDNLGSLTQETAKLRQQAQESEANASAARTPNAHSGLGSPLSDKSSSDAGRVPEEKQQQRQAGGDPRPSPRAAATAADSEPAVEGHVYRVVVRTGNRPNASATADVSIILYGSEAQTEELLLQDDDVFARNKVSVRSNVLSWNSRGCPLTAASLCSCIPRYSISFVESNRMQSILFNSCLLVPSLVAC